MFREFILQFALHDYFEMKIFRVGGTIVIKKGRMI